MFSLLFSVKFINIARCGVLTCDDKSRDMSSELNPGAGQCHRCSMMEHACIDLASVISSAKHNSMLLMQHLIIKAAGSAVERSKSLEELRRYEIFSCRSSSDSAVHVAILQSREEALKCQDGGTMLG